MKQSESQRGGESMGEDSYLDSYWEDQNEMAAMYEPSPYNGDDFEGVDLDSYDDFDCE